MSDTTTNLQLFKYDPDTDGGQTFNIDEALNNNWDSLDSLIGALTNLTTTQKASLVGAINELVTNNSGKVSKSGDTMTGNLTITHSVRPQFILKHSNIDRTVDASSDEGVMYFPFKDKNGLDFGSVGLERYTNGNNCIKLQVMNKTGSISPAIRVYATPDGNAYWTGPRSDMIDGQWTYLGQDILSGASLTNASNTDVSKTVNVPNDGRIYEILVRGRVTTGTTSGNLIRLQFTTNSCGGSVFVCSAITRAAATNGSQGTVTAYIKGGSNNMNIARASNFTGTADLHVIAYRRVGTNS